MEKDAVNPGSPAFGVRNEVCLAHQLMFQVGFEFFKHGAWSGILKMEVCFFRFATHNSPKFRKFAATVLLWFL